MNVKKHPLDYYKRFLLSRSTTASFIDTVEDLIACEDDGAMYFFHKIMIHHWNEKLNVLFDFLNDYFSVPITPVEVSVQGDITTFYTSNLNFIMKLIRLDFMFPYQRSMYNIDVLFNEKTSADFFDNNITLEDVLSSVVSRRFSEKKQLDLSNFCEDQELKEKKIYFYKLNLLASYKLLMLRIGRDTKSLNLSNNQLVQPPLDIMNFFIKGDLTEINLSHNLIPSISDLVRVSSKIEKLWLEGNPLCEDHEPSMYVKYIIMKFPRLVELDGVKLNEFFLVFPFNKNFISDSSRVTKMVVEKFLTLYFTHYDSVPRKLNVEGFYDDHTKFSITCGFRDSDARNLQRYMRHDRNILKERELAKHKMIRNKQQILITLSQLPSSKHDPSTFTVDVIKHENKNLMVIVEGIFKEKNLLDERPQVLSFRRTFFFSEYKVSGNTVYHIQNELFHISYPSPEQMANSFKYPIRDLNSFELINPEPEEYETVIKIFCHLTQLKKDEAEARLRIQRWDIKKALQDFIIDLTKDRVPAEHFVEEDDFSDSSSLIDDEMVD